MHEADSVWAPVRLGDHNSPGELLGDLRRSGISITPWAEELVDRVDLSPVQQLDLGQCFARELGFTKRTGLGEICVRALSFGLALVPPDAPLYAALQAGAKIASGEIMAFAMKAIPDRDGIPRIFLLSRTSSGSGDLRIDAGPGEADTQLDPEFRLVFRLARWSS